MPYTKKELLKNPFWQKLHEQDRVDYENKYIDFNSIIKTNLLENDKIKNLNLI